MEQPDHSGIRKRKSHPLQVFLIGRHPRRTLIRAAVLGVACYVLLRYAFVPIYVRGESMEPTYKDGSFNIANTLIFLTRDPSPGEVVVIEMAGRRTMYLKRVLAAPGDLVYFQDGALHVNEQIVSEPYVRLDGTWTTTPERLGPDEYFVAGDNRSTPWEWHTMGVVSRSRIAGRILF